MKITGEQIAKAMRKKGMDVQLLPFVAKPGVSRTPHTFGSVSLEEIADAINQANASAPGDEFYRDKASATRHKDGDIEFDDDAPVARGEDDGAYVQAWVWIDGLPPEEGDNGD